MSDREPSAFPHVSESPAGEASKPQSDAPLFSHAGREPEASPSLATPVVTSPAGSATAGNRWRWAVVGVATLLVVGFVGAFMMLAGPRAGAPSTVARYAPDNTTSYMEMRLDLPGDQRDRLATFMSHFPGFADQAAFEQKLDETLNQMLQQSQSGLEWNTDVDPWFGGQIGIFSTTMNPTPGTPPSMTIALTVKDRAALDSFLVPWNGSGVPLPTSTQIATQEEYQGTIIWTTTLSSTGDRVSFAATDEVLLIGTRVEEIKDALDVRADRRGGLADDSFFLQQLAALHADRLGIVYFDGREAAHSMRDQLGQMGQGVPTELLDWVVDAASMRVVGELRAESDHIAFTTRTERAAGADLPALPANRSTTLAEAAPKDALFYAETRDVGRTIGFALGKLLSPSASAGGLPVDLSGLELLLGTSPQEFFDFVADVAVSVDYRDGKLDAGLIATVDDNAVATSRVERLLTAARSLLQFGGGVTFAEQQHGDAKLTVITFDGPATDAGLGSIAVTVTGGRLLIGTADFVVNALDRTSDDSLAARPEYQAALQAGGTSNAGVVFVDLAAARGVIESAMPDAARAAYERDQKPFMTPFNHLAVISTTDGSLTVSHIFLYVE